MIKSSALRYIFIFLLFSNLSSFAQDADSLSQNSEMFFQQLKQILTNSPSKTVKEKSEVLINRFYPTWTAGRFNYDEKQSIRLVVEKMRNKKMRAYPQLYDYVYSIMLLGESKQLPESIINWNKYVLGLLEERKTNPFDDFMEFTHDLLERKILSKKKSLFWYHRNSKFEFVQDTVFLLKFNKLNLIGATKFDSSVILKTRGDYDYKKGYWYGKDANINWRRFGNEMGDSIFVKADNYFINFYKSEYSIDSAVLTDNRFFSENMLGVFTDRVASSRPNKRTSYPRFITYLKDYHINNLYENISFTGGFKHAGLSLYGVSDDFNFAELELFHNDTVFGRVFAQDFKMDKKVMDAAKAEVVFYLNNDSIYHPGIRLKYQADKKQLIVYNENEGSRMVPFFDSYHQLDIYVQAMFWNMTEPEMTFKKIRAVNNANKATFVSSNFYSAKDFYSLQGIDDLNPLYVIENYMNDYNVDEIQLNALAAFMKKPVEQVSAMLISLSKKGYLVYNTESETAVVKKRLLHFLKAKTGNTDYDVIQLESNVKAKENASINLENLELTVNGVPFVQISDSQEVYIYPYNKSISFEKNRNFNFDGYVRMGALDFYSRESNFVYDSFMLSMNFIDSLAFWVKAFDTIRHRGEEVRVDNVIRDLNGKIYIDNPHNKSGLKRFSEYPKFVSEEESYVYYNRKDIQDSSLIRDRFFYTVDPFVFDSIGTFSTDGLAFEGKLTSGGIFDPIDEPLIVMPDYSLGFKHYTDQDGYTIYGADASFTNEIQLNNSGFAGNGTLKFLNSQMLSDNFIFYPDSLKAQVRDFVSIADAEKYNFPDAQIDTASVNWQIDTNNMLLYSDIKPFIIYNNSNFNGKLNLNPEYMKGDGEFNFDQSEVISHDINFMYSKLTADSAIFNLRDQEGKNLIFKSSGYFATIDFENQKGLFNNLYNNSFIEFPFNKYISTLDEMEWDMYNDKLNLSGNLSKNHIALDTLSDVDLIDYKLSGPEFISVNAEQDSLRFFAGKADYNLQDYTLNVEQARMLKVADAAIFPDGQNLQIIRDGHIPTLKSARIITDTADKHHYFYDAEVDLFSRHKYKAKGYIDYVDRFGLKQPVWMNRIEANGDVSQAFTSLPTGEVFFLSPEYFFTGDISITADEKLWKFTGGFQISQECLDLNNNWIAYDDYIDPQNLVFTLDKNSMSVDSSRAVFGLAYSSQYGGFYPRVFQALKSSSDFVMIGANGQMVYDTAKQSFIVSTEERLNNDLIDDNLVELETKRCILNADGPVDLGLNSNVFRSLSAGKITHKIIPDSTYYSSSLLLDFMFDKKALKFVSDSLKLSPNEPLSPSEGNYPVFLKKILGTEKSAIMITELALYGQIKKLPDELNSKLIFTELNLRYDKKSKSFVSVGKIGLGYVDGEAVNKYFDGFVQIELGRSGSGINILLKPNKKSWYFFSYKYGIMQFMSSDDNVNSYIDAIKPEKKMLNPDSETDYYEYVVSTRRKVIDFERKMLQINKK